MSAGGTDRLDYMLAKDSSYSTIWANTQATSVALGPGNIYARVPTGQNVASGTHTDSVLITVTYSARRAPQSTAHGVECA